MNTFIPSDSEVAVIYSSWASPLLMESRRVMFDRWLEKTRREAAAKAWDEAVEAVSEQPEVITPESIGTNPYRP